MAITIISQPPEYTGAYGKNRIKANTLNVGISQFRYEIEKDGDVLSNQFIPIYPIYVNSIITFLSSNIDVKGLYMSSLPLYDNPILTPSTFTEIDAQNHQAKITDVLLEDEPSGDYVEIERNIFKAVDVKYGVEWDINKNYIPLEKDKNGKIIRKVFNNMKIPVSYYTFNKATSYNISLTNGAGTSVLGATNLENNYRLATFTLNTNYINNYISLPLSNANIHLVLDEKGCRNKKILYFINKYGGWDWFCANDFESREITDKSQYTKYKDVEGDVEVLQLVDGYVIEQRLYGQLMDTNSYEYLKDMINSPIIIDDKGERVRLIDTQFRYNFRDLIEPIFTIQYLKKETINY